MIRTAAVLAALGAFAVLVAAPAASLVALTVWRDGGLTLEPVRSVLTDARSWTLLGNTLFLGGAVALLTFAVGAPLGFLVARTDLPGAAVLRPLLAAPLLVPPLLHAIAWTDLVKIRGAAAAVGIFSLAYYPFVMLLTAGAAERVDGRLGEAARLLGGKRLAAAVAARALLPAALAGAAFAFLFVVSDFSVPDYLSSVGPKLNVYADEIFTRWQRQGDTGGAVAAALPPAILGILSLTAIAKLRGARASATIGEQFSPPRRLTLGRWRWPAFAFAAAVLGLGLVAPLASFVWRTGSPAVFFDSLGQARGDILQSLLTALAAALAAGAVSFTLTHAFRRRSRKWTPALSPALDGLAALALALPAIAFAIALIRLWNRDGLPGLVYTSPAVVVAAFAGRYFLFAQVLTASGLDALDPGLEDAAALAGMGPVRRALAVSARLAAPSIGAGCLLVYVFAMRELDTIVLIPAGNRSAMFRIYNAIHFNRPEFVAALSLALSLLTVAPIVLYTAVLGRRLDVPAWGHAGARA